jgi:hypothetical protein
MAVLTPYASISSPLGRPLVNHPVEGMSDADLELQSYQVCPVTFLRYLIRGDSVEQVRCQEAAVNTVVVDSAGSGGSARPSINVSKNLRRSTPGVSILGVSGAPIKVPINTPFPTDDRFELLLRPTPMSSPLMHFRVDGNGG